MSLEDSSAASLKVLNINVPRLLDDGSNWPGWKTMVQLAVGSKSKGLLKHLDGMAIRPEDLTFDPKTKFWSKTGTTDVPTADEIKTFTDELDTYEWHEAQAKGIIMATLNDRMQMEARQKETAAEIWDLVVKEHEGKRELVHIQLLSELQALRCKEGGDIRAHLTEMLRLREALANINHKVGDDSFKAQIMLSLPKSWKPILQSMLAASKAAKQSLPVETLITNIRELLDIEGTETTYQNPNVALHTYTPRGNFYQGRGRGRGRGRGYPPFTLPSTSYQGTTTGNNVGPTC